MPWASSSTCVSFPLCNSRCTPNRIIHPQCKWYGNLHNTPNRNIHPQCKLHYTSNRNTYPQCNWLPFQPVFCVYSIAFFVLCISIEIMVEQLVKITSEYEERLRRCQYVPRFSFRRRMLGDDGGPNRYFLMYLFCEQSMAVQYAQGYTHRTVSTTYSRRSARQNASHHTCYSCISSRTLTGLCALVPALSAPRDGPRSVRHLRYQVRPRYILIILRLESFWVIFFNNLSPPLHFPFLILVC